eukprot:NODE_1716_length_758_cov_88.678288_g1667_i0.p1 GENE.NODE_1716_length_758_cov_88.678288_g1667_i0~~NODE_1716_length_758_cov_88.678288_g1667_i0.p1  ORF type:complete len:212 (-),score=21.80 NODE_1716_length_758_cov_88.678288_g1667_i0:40-675(-)
MALPSRPLGYLLKRASAVHPTKVECFCDPVCPFSCKMLKTLATSVVDSAPEHIEFVVHHCPQPWHPQSGMTIEAALAVEEVCIKSGKPDDSLSFYKVLCEHQQQFVDVETYDKSRKQICDELADLAGATGVDREAVRALLQLNPEELAQGFKNPGTCVNQRFKQHVKFHRKRGVHVTPTVFVNGVEAGEVSSGWSGEQWLEFLQKFQASPV